MMSILMTHIPMITSLRRKQPRRRRGSTIAIAILIILKMKSLKRKQRRKRRRQSRGILTQKKILTLQRRQRRRRERRLSFRTAKSNSQKSKKGTTDLPNSQKLSDVASAASLVRTTMSVRAGLQFPVARCLRKLKQRRVSKRVSKDAAVYLAAVLEYLAAEVLELAGNAARDNHRVRVS